LRIPRQRASGLLIALGIACALALAACNKSPSDALTPPGVVRLTGSPEEIGRQHGSLLADEIKTMIREYVQDDLDEGTGRADLLARVRAMKPSLPDWYMRELAACANAAGVDEDALLYAQCEGDIKDLGGCTTYVAFGPATSNGTMEIGRNFDYWGLDSTRRCAKIFAFIPRPEDGYAFVSVGWTGILGGWTFINEKGLFVANNVGMYGPTNPKGVPTLILERIIAQKAATLDEAIEIIENTPRMRGQVLVIGQIGDAERGLPPDAAVIRYNARDITVEKATNGLASDSSIGSSMKTLQGILHQSGRKPMDGIRSAGSSITLHSVTIRPQEHRIWVAHGRKSKAHRGKYVEYDVQSLLKR